MNVATSNTTIPTYNWVIYKITNPNDCVYIGKTKNLKGRISNYKNLSNSIRKQKLLYNSLAKYGFESHSIEIIDTFNSTLSYVNGKEIFWIRSYMCNARKWREHNGLNLTNGGDGNVGMKYPDRGVSKLKGTKISEERKKALSEYNKKYPSRPMLNKNHTEEAKIKISESKKNKPSPHKGKKMSLDFIEKNRLSHIGIASKNKGKKIWSEADKKRIGLSKIGNTYMKGKKLNENQIKNCINAALPRCKNIIQYDLDGNFLNEFISSRQAAKKTNMSRLSIIKILNGITKNPKKYIFKYK